MNSSLLHGARTFVTLAATALLISFIAWLPILLNPTKSLALEVTESSLENAQIIPYSEEFEAPESLSDYGSISVKHAITIEDETIPLYPTFDDLTVACEKATANAEQILTLLMKDYDLNPFSPDTWEEYRSALYIEIEKEDCPEWLNESQDEYLELLCFFDIAENDSVNESIANGVNVIESSIASDLVLSDISENVLLSLPETEGVSISLPQDPSTATTYSFSKSKAITYANKYAIDPNVSGYGYFGKADCTNFASQILEKGGVSQVVSTSRNKGWWHKRKVVDTEVIHTYSKSWTAANIFCNYMGIGYKTKSNSAFSNNIAKGDFIAADWATDGSWDHLGFIVDKKTTKSNGFYDYKVAQHTTNYVRWASASNNNWDLAGSKGGTYARIRR